MWTSSFIFSITSSGLIVRWIVQPPIPPVNVVNWMGMSNIGRHSDIAISNLCLYLFIGTTDSAAFAIKRMWQTIIFAVEFVIYVTPWSQHSSVLVCVTVPLLMPPVTTNAIAIMAQMIYPNIITFGGNAAFLLTIKLFFVFWLACR